MELAPEDAYIYDSRGEAYYGLEEFEKALADYDKALELDPTMSTSYKYRGFVQQALGNAEQAIADLEQYLTLEPEADDRAEIEATLAELQ